jgi:hypothetical protein
MTEAIDVNEDNYLIELINNFGRVSTGNLRKRFNIPTGVKGLRTMVKNPLYIKGTTSRKQVQLKTFVSNINKKIRKDGAEFVTGLLSGDPTAILEQVSEEVIEGRLDIDELLRQIEEGEEIDLDVPEGDPRSIEEIIQEIESRGLEQGLLEPLPEPEEVPSALPARSRSEVGGWNILRNARTITDFKRGLVSSVTGGVYIGSGTPLIEFLERGVKPSGGPVDTIALEHDIAYTTATTDKEVNDADALFIERLNDEFKRNPFSGSNAILAIAGTLMSAKTAVDRLPFSRTETWFVDYEENKNRPDNVKNILHAIQSNLESQEMLTEESTNFIFTPEIQRAIKGQPQDMEQQIENLTNFLQIQSQEDTEKILSVVKQQNPELYREFTKRTQPETRPPSPEPETRPPSPEPETRPSLSPKEPVHPSFRKGHDDRVRQEQMLQRLQQEEQDRRMGLIYENNPDDYMAAPVPNHYMRPMFATQWLDIEKLKQYQTPEYVKAEKKIYERNWQTPFQYGEGTPDNSVKDIENIVERLARLEHHLRYDLSTKGLPKDQVNVSVRYGEPMRRTGRIPISHHERYDIYTKMNKDMSAYQYQQRQNEPPRTKLINREQQQFKLTRENQGQQKVYDELATEGLPTLDIKNEYDMAYYERRIRKR